MHLEAVKVVDQLEELLVSLVVTGTNQASRVQLDRLRAISNNLRRVRLEKVAAEADSLAEKLDALFLDPASFNRRVYSSRLVSLLIKSRLFRNFIHGKLADQALANRILFGAPPGEVPGRRTSLRLRCVGADFQRNEGGTFADLVLLFLAREIKGDPGESDNGKWSLAVTSMREVAEALSPRWPSNVRKIETLLGKGVVGITLRQWCTEELEALGVELVREGDDDVTLGTGVASLKFSADTIVSTVGPWNHSGVAGCFPPDATHDSWPNLLGEVKTDAANAILAEDARPVHCVASPASLGPMKYSRDEWAYLELFDGNFNSMVAKFDLRTGVTTRRNVEFLSSRGVLPTRLIGRASVNASGALEFEPTFVVFSDSVQTRCAFVHFQSFPQVLKGMDLSAMRVTRASRTEVAEQVDAIAGTGTVGAGRGETGGGIDLDSLVGDD